MPPTTRATFDANGNLTAIETFQGPRGWVHVLSEPIQRADVPDLAAAIRERGILDGSSLTPAASPAMVEAYKAGCEREAARRRAAGNCSYKPESIIAAGLAAVLDVARPTPDEARRLVEALHLDLLATADTVAALHGAIGTGLRNHCVAAADKLRLTAGTARAALLRALGVEA